MEKSIIYIHPMDTITTSTDGKLYKKVDGEYIENPEFVRVITDSNDNIIDYTDKNGKRWIHDLHADNIIENFSEIEDIENRISMQLDPNGKILSYRDKDGILYENCGIITPSVEITDKILLNDSTKSSLVNTLNFFS